MDVYPIIKMIHIISATILFGTGIGIAFFFFLPHLRQQDVTAKLAAARTTVTADFLFTLPAVIVQPLTGAWLVWKGGFDWADYWLVMTYGLYVVAGLCWVPVVIIQIRLKQMLEAQAAGVAIDQPMYDRLFRCWFILGWPAFGGLVVTFFLMVAKPTW